MKVLAPASAWVCAPFLLLTLSVLLPVRAAENTGALRYTTGWLGNSFPGGPKWVQNFNEQMTVLPDGTVYLASF